MIRKILRTIRHQIIIRYLNIYKNSSVLDTSCGNWDFLKILFKKDNTLKIFWIDCDTKTINDARINFPQWNFFERDAKNTWFESEQFQTVLSVLTLHHISNPLFLLNEFKRITSKNGVIYLIDIVPRHEKMKRILNIVKCPENYHFEKFYTLNEIEKLILLSWLKIISKKQIFVWPLIRFWGNVWVFKLSTSTNE